MLQDFFGRLGKLPDQVTAQDVFVFAHGPGLRDRAIILTLVLTGRRRAEVIGMKAGDLSVEGDRTYYSYRGKGGKRGRRELPKPAVEAIRAALAAFGLTWLPWAPEAGLCGLHVRQIAGD